VSKFINKMHVHTFVCLTESTPTRGEDENLTDNCLMSKDIEFQAVSLKTTICLSDEHCYLKCEAASLLFSAMNK